MSRSDFALSYTKSPIIFCDGMAQNVPGKKVPIVAVTQSLEQSTGFLQAQFEAQYAGLDNFDADFYPLPGGTLAEYQVATYPFANQTVAGNSIISQPLHISMLMIAPANSVGAYSKKSALFQSIKSAVTLHSRLGGTYNVATPAYVYTNCILTSLRDVSDGDPKRPQEKWQWDFTQPLLTLQQAAQAYNAMTSRMDGGTQLLPDAYGYISATGGAANTGGNPTASTSQSVIAGSKGNLAASVDVLNFDIQSGARANFAGG